MERRRRAHVFYTCLFCLSFLTHTVWAGPQEFLPGHGAQSVAPPSEIWGTVRFNGFDGDAAAVGVQAVPMGVRSSDGKEFTPDPRARIRSALLAATDEPGLFKFLVTGLQPGTLYRLGVTFPPSPIEPKVFWRGPLDGIVMSGGPPVSIEGFVARTELEILDTHGEWVGADDLQFTDPAAAVRTLRWKSSIPGVTAGELQISTTAFPLTSSLDPCAEPAGGVIYRQQFPVRGTAWQGISSLDFGQILTPRDGLRGEGDAIPASISRVAAVSDADLKMLSIGAPLYMRVVPMTDSGPACDVGHDGVHGWVIVAKLPAGFDVPEPTPQPLLTPDGTRHYTPPKVEYDYVAYGTLGAVPTYGEVAYTVIKPHTLPECYSGVICGGLPGTWTDPIGYNLVGLGIYPPGATLYPGTFFKFTPITVTSDAGTIADTMNTIGGLGSGLVTGTLGVAGDFVNFLSQMAAEIKAGVAAVVADVLTSLPVIGEACNLVTSCQNLVEMGINYGLTSMGIPPSLPNWDQLKSQGMDYLAAEIASGISTQTGLPEELTSLGVEEAMGVAKDMAEGTIEEMTEKRGGDDARYDWVVPSLGMEPAIWSLGVKLNGQELPSGVHLRTLGNALFMPNDVVLPTMFPSTNFLRIPVVLYPNTAGIHPPVCRPDLIGRLTCTPNTIPGLTTPLCQAQSYNWQTHEWEWKAVDCTFFGNAVAIYYRDAWLNKLKSSGCLTLAGSSFVSNLVQAFPPLFQWDSFPVPPFVDFVHVHPLYGANYSEAGYTYPGCNIQPLPFE
jgi:hypothetical protein